MFKFRRLVRLKNHPHPRTSTSWIPETFARARKAFPFIIWFKNMLLGVSHRIIGNDSLYDAQLKVGGTAHDLHDFFNDGPQQAGYA